MARANPKIDDKYIPTVSRRGDIICRMRAMVEGETRLETVPNFLPTHGHNSGHTDRSTKSTCLKASDM